MKDQADNLRQVIENLKIKQSNNQGTLLNNLGNKKTKVITVTSGKGGVGKTSITVNLAISLSEMGFRVAVLDADFGLANIDVILGMAPKFTLVDVIKNNKSIIEVLADGPKNIKYISGGSGVEELVKLDRIQIERFIKNIELLDKIFDIIIIDTGAGLSENVVSFVMAADEVLLVTTPEPTSITDAYALIKTVSKKDSNKTIKVIVNRAENIKEAEDILGKLSMVADKFLSVRLISAGFILQDDLVAKAVKLQQPFSLIFPKTPASKSIREISSRFIEKDESNTKLENTGIKGFVSRLVGIMKAH